MAQVAVLVGDKKQAGQTLREVRDQHYEVAADFQGALKSAVIARMSGAKQIVGFQHPREWPARALYQRHVDARGAHVIQQYHSLAQSIAGKPLPETSIDLPHDQAAEASMANKISGFAENLVILNPGAGWGSKQWAADRYGEVARQLSQSGFRCLVNFGPTEEELAMQVQATSKGAAQPISCSVSELIALLCHARLFIGGDTGPLHLAAALQVPVVAIFGPTDPTRNGPFGTQSLVLRNPASKTSLSHTSAADPGLLAISADEVVSAARELLRSTNA